MFAEAGYPHGFDAGDLYPWPREVSAGEAIANDVRALGITTRVGTMERAASYSALATKKLGGLCLCIVAVYGNAAARLAKSCRSRSWRARGSG